MQGGALLLQPDVRFKLVAACTAMDVSKNLGLRGEFVCPVWVLEEGVGVELQAQASVCSLCWRCEQPHL